MLLKNIVNASSDNLNDIAFKIPTCILNILNDCNIDNIFLDLHEDNVSTDWASKTKNIMRDLSLSHWLDDGNRKSSIQDYMAIKNAPNLEEYLLDRCDFEGASIKFKLRSNTLPLNYKVAKFSNMPYEDGTCKLCNTGEDEDLIHFLLNCPILKNIREVEIAKFKQQLYSNNLLHVLQEFEQLDNRNKLHFILGNENNNFYNNTCINILIDKFCKSLAKSLWKNRCELLKFCS